ncbi:MAG TPA: TIGR00269 family protein [Actinomycetota bacterium]
MRSVRQLLQKLELNPETVLVIRGADLLTREEELTALDEVEIRPVISGGQRNVAKCKRCGDRARVEVPRANAAFCNECFLRYVNGQVMRAVEDYEMFSKADRLMVCVSGGKDSLALWDILTEMGYDTTGYYISLGTGKEYTDESRRMCEQFADARGLKLIVTDLAEDEGFTIEEISKDSRRVPCSACGLAKRYLTNLTAAENGFDALVTGHNLDDEAATLMGNTLHWNTEYIARQAPALPASAEGGFVRKVKPLVRVSERETAAYCVIRGIDYVIEECPLVAGNTQLRYKDVLNDLERRSPGTKQQFLFGFLDKAAVLFAATDRPSLRACRECRQPTTGDLCAFCRLRDQVARTRERRAAGGTR